MAGMGNARGGLGWVILVVALAVPGVLFYNWWSHLKADREKAVAAKARSRVPEGGVFQSSPNAPLVNPMAPAVSTETATALVAEPIGPAPVAAVPVAPPALPAPDMTPPPAVSSTTAAALPLKRDPTLSPFDQVRLMEEEEARRAAADALASARSPRGGKAKPMKTPSAMVELMGIISNAESGFKAIVNNEVIGVGEFVGSTKIKVVKITDLGVTFDFKGKRFSKSVGQD